MSHSLYPPRVIAFEGVDGAGKTAVLGLVAQHLRDMGVEVCLPRIGKQHTSKPIREIRQLTRDRTNLELCPRTELLLYAAREAQVLEQVVRPALAQGATVLLDRSMLTPVGLGAYGRGLDLDSCAAITREASGGQVPNHTLIFDVEPRTSRIRKRLEKIQTGQTRNAGRKGLAGSAMQERVREGYLSLAARDGLPILHCERGTPSDIASRVVSKLETGTFSEDGEQKPWWHVDPAASFEQAVEQLPDLVRLYFTRGLRLGRALRAELFEREPALTIWAADLEDPLLTRALERAPELVLARLLLSPAAVALRERLLTSHPAEVARSLVQVAGDDADHMRMRLAELAPGAVVESLSGRSDAFATTLRKRLWKQADIYERAASLELCDDDWAWHRRERLLDEDPAVVLPSLRGLSPERVDPLLAPYYERAPKSVLSALSGRSDTHAHQLRARLIGTGREVIDSVKGLDDPRSWLLRECFCERWPSTVVSSLLGMPLSNRAKALVARCREAAPDDLFTKRRLFLLDEPLQQPRGLDDD
jgi:dTMP kinase